MSLMRTYRRALGLSQSAFAAQLNVPRPSTSTERTSAMPTLVIVRRPRTARSVTQTVRMRFLVGTGDRLGATHRVDLRRAKGTPASRWSTFA